MTPNADPIERRSCNGTTFECARADLREPIKYRNERPISTEQFAADVAEFAAWHRMFIWKQLNGFSGYNTLTFEKAK